MVIQSIFIFIFGLIIGSFLTLYTYRSPRTISVKKGRSKCDRCGKKISWFDNIPLISYLLLKGKCRYCGNKISLRYPLIEFSTGILFAGIYYFYINCATILQGGTFEGNPFCAWTDLLGLWILPYLLLVSTVLVAIFVIDLEHQIIPDNLVFLLFVVNIMALILFRVDNLYEILFVSFAASLFFLMLHLVTKGRGMGLGAVKLVLALSPIFTWQVTITWIFLSFVIGAILGLILISLKRASFGKHIAFGPFLIFSFFIALFWGESLSRYIIPYMP